MSEQQQQAPEPESGATGPASATAGPEQQQAWTQGGGRSDTAGPEDRRGSGAADGTSPGDSFGQPPLKRQRSGPAPPPLMLEQPTAGVLVAWPAHGAVPPLADPAALVGTRLSGVVEAVTEGAIYVSISLPHGGEWKGESRAGRQHGGRGLRTREGGLAAPPAPRGVPGGRASRLLCRLFLIHRTPAQPSPARSLKRGSQAGAQVGARTRPNPIFLAVWGSPVVFVAVGCDFLAFRCAARLPCSLRPLAGLAPPTRPPPLQRMT